MKKIRSAHKSSSIEGDKPINLQSREQDAMLANNS